MQAKANIKQTLWVLLIALALIVLCVGGLWAYVKSADAETGLTETSLTELPKADEAAFTREKYDNYPLESAGSNFGWDQGKALIPSEIKRLKELTEAYAGGKRPDAKAPSIPGAGSFAIIPLDPKDFAGITEYYILPETWLSDQELLMLIDYCANIGMTFTEDTLTTKNCMRGNNTNTNRYLSAGESERRDILLRRVMMEGLRTTSPEPTIQTLPISGVAGIRLNPDKFSNMDAFHLYPIREMTDEELLQSLYLDYMDGYTYLSPSSVNGLDPAADEARMRSFLMETMGMPMAAENTNLSYKQKTATGEVHLHAYFKTALINGREADYKVILQKSSGDILYSLRLTSNLANPYSINTVDPPKPEVDLNDPKWKDIATETVSKLTKTPITSVTVYDIFFMGDDREPIIQVNVNLENGSSYIVHILLSTEKAASVQYLHYDLKLINDYIW
jgi:hypothetical protein